MRIAEIYQSIQGEGLLTGRKSVFVRASGCNLRCWFCDTKFASWKPQGSDISVEDIVAQVLLLDCEHVVITGGEPMLFSELIPICEMLSAEQIHITIETAGTLHLPVECDLMSISPKFAGSAPSSTEQPKWNIRHQNTRHQPDVIRELISNYDYQIKFVINDPQEFQEVESYLMEFPMIDEQRVLLMPQAVSREQMQQAALWLEPFCKKNGFTYCPRMQIEWFGMKQGT